MAPKVKQEKSKAAAAPKKTKPAKKDAAAEKNEETKKEEPIVKTEPGSSSSSSKEVIQVSRGALSALITSLKHQTKAKKATEEHNAAAQKLLDEF